MRCKGCNFSKCFAREDGNSCLEVLLWSPKCFLIKTPLPAHLSPAQAPAKGHGFAHCPECLFQLREETATEENIGNRLSFQMHLSGAIWDKMNGNKESPTISDIFYMFHPALEERSRKKSAPKSGFQNQMPV